MRLQTGTLRYEFISFTLTEKEISFCNVLLMRKNHTLYIKYFSLNYALRSALLPHAKTPSPDVPECNQSLWQLPECFYEPVSLIHSRYTPALRMSVQQYWVSLRTAAHCRE